MPITVDGIVITDSQIADATEALRQMSYFTYGEVQAQLKAAGAQTAATYRGADRLLQKLRKAGQISYANGRWGWVEARGEGV